MDGRNQHNIETHVLHFAAFFAIARTWKQPRYPWTDEWIQKLWYVYTMEYYSAIKKKTNTSESVLMRWARTFNHTCKVPFAVEGSIFTGARDESMGVFGDYLCANHRHFKGELGEYFYHPDIRETFVINRKLTHKG